MSTRTMIVLFGWLVLVASGCGDPCEGDHPVSKDGTCHGSGLKSAEQECIECHGQDLRGEDGPSCYSCHQREW